MSKFAVIGDIHYGVKNWDVEFKLQVKDFFDSVIEKCLGNQIDQVIFLGDYFHDRTKIPVNEISPALTLYKSFESFFKKIYLITGNHDMGTNDSNDGRNSIAMFSSEITTVVPNMMDAGNIVLVSYITDEKILDVIRDGCVRPYLMGHFAHSNYYPECVKETLIADKDIARYRKVISGHLHTPSRHTYTGGEYINLGTPFPLTRADKQGRWCIFDDVTGEVTYIPYKSLIEFVTVEVGDVISEDKIRGNCVTILFSMTDNVKPYAQKIAEMKPLEIKYTSKVSASQVIKQSADTKKDEKISFMSILQQEVAGADIEKRDKEQVVKFLSKFTFV